MCFIHFISFRILDIFSRVLNNVLQSLKLQYSLKLLYSDLKIIRQMYRHFLGSSVDLYSRHLDILRDLSFFHILQIN